MAKQSIGLGSSANAGNGDPLRTAFDKTNQNFDELYGRVANGVDYGAVADGSGSLHTAVAAALSAGVRTLVLDEGSSFYRLTNTLTLPSGFRIVNGKGRPVIKMDNAANSRMVVLSNVTDAGIRGISIDGNKSVTPSDATVVVSGGSLKCAIEDVVFNNCPSASTGAVVISGATTNRNAILKCQFDGSEGTSIGLSGGSENTIAFNELRDSGTFGIFLNTGAVRNLIQANRSITSGLESVALTYDCHSNRVIGNHCELAGDNGISVSGQDNIASGNICLSNHNAGIGIWGSNNTVSGNILKRSNFGNDTTFFSGVWVHAQYGGIGSSNVISDNVCDDDQAVPTQNYGVALHGSGYTAWAAGQAITDLTDFTQLWRVSGLNIYRAASTGTTGATAPSHTSGTVSDGAVSWTYVNSFVSAVGTLWNQVADNIVRRSKTASYFDADNWQRNVLFSSTTTSLAITADGLVRARPS